MSSSSSKSRPVPPSFRAFLKPAPDVTPDSSPHGSASVDFLSRSPSMLSGKASTPSKGRPSLSPLASLAPQKLRFSVDSSAGSGSPSDSPSFGRAEESSSSGYAKENVTVTVRFRPLSPRETQRGDEVAWYADGETTVCSEYNPAISYAFDRVFGPATTTRHVYDVAAQHIVDGAMEGINGTVFAYGVTSSGKTHTMHGNQKSPGIIPLAVKDVFSFIQETPRREFLLRVSYLEIYNEVINDLLDPAGQNLRIREDAQGTYVEGIKEEVVLSPAHCLSLIAAGEEHRHVGANNFNLLSSRSHTIFTLIIESSRRGDDFNEEEVTLSQLNLIDLAGSESSKTETTGHRRKEGSCINRSLSTLGTVILKLTDGKTSHIPYRDSKLTRLLQSSLSGHGRISLICTVTPSSTSNEETHNTLKFAHRAKNVQIHASQNRIVDEKSLIKKYQKEILHLKLELEQMKHGMANNTHLMGSQEASVPVKQQLEAGQLRLQSKIEEEEQAKAALLGRIQRLTKLILVSTKHIASQNLSDRRGNQRRHSFGEEELAYLPDRRRELMYEDDSVQDLEPSLSERSENIISDDVLKGDKRYKKRSMLTWFKMKKNEHTTSAVNMESENSSNVSSATSGYAFMHASPGVDSEDLRRSITQKVDAISAVNPIPEGTQGDDVLSATAQGRKPPVTGMAMADQIDLLREQVKMLGGEVALCSSLLKKLSDQAVRNHDDSQLQVHLKDLIDEIQEKKRQMCVLEQRIFGNVEITCNSHATSSELSHNVSKLTEQLNEKSFEFEIKSADNRSVQEQLNAKVEENVELQKNGSSLHEQLVAIRGSSQQNNVDSSCKNIAVQQGTLKATDEMACLKAQLLQQMKDMERLMKENEKLYSEKDELQIQGSKLAEEASCAKELASAAAVELKNLAEEVTKLCYQNTKLAAELSSIKESTHGQPPRKSVGRRRMSDTNLRRMEEAMNEELTRELLASKEREITLEAALVERESKIVEIQKKLEEATRREAELENNLKSMWVLVAKLKKLKGIKGKGVTNNLEYQELLDLPEMINTNGMGINGLKEALESEKSHTAELEMLILQLKSEDLSGLDLAALEDLSALHMEALTRLRHAKASLYGMIEKECENEPVTMKGEHVWKTANGVCRMCSANFAAILLPCCHFFLCKSCAVACTECPLCRTTIKERIIT